jgi:hypothetical protein
MRKTDIDMLNHDEAQAVDDSFDSVTFPARIGSILLGTFLAICVVLALLVLEASAGVIAAAFAVVLAISTLEKASYARAQMNAEAAIRKLVHRIEDLEGVPSTPDNAKPTKLAMGKSGRAA